MRLSRTATFWVVVAAYLILMISASTPSPLYVVYQAEWHFPTSTLTVVFGVYAVALLLSLLTVGGLSDFVGRRPVLVGALALLTASMIVFAEADGLPWLYAARIMQGLAAGASIGTLSAGIVSLAPSGRERLAGLLNALIPSVGLGLGALVAGAFAEYAPNPTVLVFVVVAAALAVLVIVLGFAHEEQDRRGGALTSLVPRVRVAAPVRGAFLRATPSLFAPWAQMGLTLSLLVSLAAAQFGIRNHFESGLIVVTVCLAGTVSGFVLRDTSPAQSNRFGALGLIVGIGVTLAGLHADSLAVFVLGSALGGLGLGASMSGSIRTMSVLPAPAERGEFFAAVYTVGYLAFSVPAVIAGFAAVHFGLLDVAYVYGAGVVLLALGVLALSARAAEPAPVLATAEPELAGCRD
ncbi:MAG TPA: MFS transporter [Jatrophihabitans sp.]|jgi:MFS family permease